MQLKYYENSKDYMHICYANMLPWLQLGCMHKRRHKIQTIIAERLSFPFDGFGFNDKYFSRVTLATSIDTFDPRLRSQDSTTYFQPPAAKSGREGRIRVLGFSSIKTMTPAPPMSDVSLCLTQRSLAPLSFTSSFIEVSEDTGSLKRTKSNPLLHSFTADRLVGESRAEPRKGPATVERLRRPVLVGPPCTVG